MKSLCQKTREALASEGAAALRPDDVLRAHLEECGDCAAAAERLAQLETALRAMPAPDAPDELVETLLARPELEARPQTRNLLARVSPPASWRKWLAAAAVLAIAIGTVRFMVMPSLLRGRVLAPQVAEVGEDRSEARFDAPSAPSPALPPPPPPPPLPAAPPPIPDEAARDALAKLEGDALGQASGRAMTEHEMSEEAVPGPVFSFTGERPAIESFDENKRATGAKDDQAQLLSRPDRAVPAPSAGARGFLEELSALENLDFREPEGYWANTYVPGDPLTRWLAARLQHFDPRELESYTGTTLRLHQGIRTVAQPFDAPDNAAIALSLLADRAAVQGETRVRIQVGLKAIERHAARRPSMNVAVVLDLRGDVSVETAAGMRALLFALERAREAGDRFRLVVAGRPGGVALEPERFESRELRPLLDRLLASAAGAQGESLGIAEALALAIQSVHRDEDPQAVLGASSILLVTGQPLGQATETLAALSHRSAVAGMPVSVAAVGAGAPPLEIERVVLAGQGNRLFLARPSDAEALVDRELTAASRAVARALRLRIRLARGVKLVDVLGSRRLDEVEAERVRVAEKSIDLRLLRNLGIEADRGEDEDGIQIVIPTFYAGDEHVVLLDVVAPGPGAVADVRVRFKDVAFLRNGVAQGSLSLPRGDRAPGPVEWSVLRNVLAHRLSESLEQSGLALSRGDVVGARSLLVAARDLLEGVAGALPGLDDRTLRNDIEVLNEYDAILASGAIAAPSIRSQIATSLRYASRIKAHSGSGG